MDHWESPLRSGQYVFTAEYGWVRVQSNPRWLASESCYTVLISSWRGDSILESRIWFHRGPGRFSKCKILEITTVRPSSFPLGLEEEFFSRERGGS